jgi:hypothetical protein
LFCLALASSGEIAQISTASAQNERSEAKILQRNRTEVGDFGPTNYHSVPNIDLELPRRDDNYHLKMLMKFKAYPRVLVFLESVVRRHPNDIGLYTKLIEVHVLYGNMLAEKGDTASAVQQYSAAIDLNQGIMMFRALSQD